MSDSAWVKFRDEAEAIIGIGWNFFAPIAAVAVSVFGLPTWVPAALAAIPAAMSQVSGTGTAKKAEVMNITKIIMDTLDKELSGGAKGTFDKLELLISTSIDSTITTINKVAPAIIANDAPPVPVQDTSGNVGA